MSDIDAIIAEAKARAAEANKGTEVAVASGSTNLPSTSTRGAPLGLDDLLSGAGMTVDHWLKINEFGIFVGQSKQVFNQITAAIDLAQVKYKYSIRYGQNPVQYDHTYDHRVSVKGRSWADAVEAAKKVTPDANEYRSADIPLVNVEELKGGKEVIAPPFSTLGLTLNVTGWRKWETFVQSLPRAGVNPQSDIVLVELTMEERKKNGNTWGLPVFTFKEKLDEMPS